MIRHRNKRWALEMFLGKMVLVLVSFCTSQTAFLIWIYFSMMWKGRAVEREPGERESREDMQNSLWKSLSPVMDLWNEFKMHFAFCVIKTLRAIIIWDHLSIISVVTGGMCEVTLALTMANNEGKGFFCCCFIKAWRWSAHSSAFCL